MRYEKVIVLSVGLRCHDDRSITQQKLAAFVKKRRHRRVLGASFGEVAPREDESRPAVGIESVIVDRPKVLVSVEFPRRGKLLVPIGEERAAGQEQPKRQ